MEYNHTYGADNNGNGSYLGIEYSQWQNAKPDKIKQETDKHELTYKGKLQICICIISAHSIGHRTPAHSKTVAPETTKYELVDGECEMSEC
eukprot:14970722-Heterocapsa_arctica.AAC.1